MCNKDCCCKELNLAIEVYTSFFRRKTSPYVAKSNFKKESYPFIPLNNSIDSINRFKDIRNYLILRDSLSTRWYDKKLKFLDAGCGIGNIMILAKICGFDVSGIEYNTTTHRYCKEIHEYDAHVIKGDITKFKSYHKYDVIYYYVPIDDREKMLEFTERLAKNMKVGAIVDPHGGSHESFKNDSFKVVRLHNRWEYFYEKVK